MMRIFSPPLYCDDRSGRDRRRPACRPPAPPIRPKVLAPFLNGGPTVVVRIDPAQIDLKAMETWLSDRLRAGAVGGDDKDAQRREGIHRAARRAARTGRAIPRRSSKPPADARRTWSSACPT